MTKHDLIEWINDNMFEGIELSPYNTCQGIYDAIDPGKSIEADKIMNQIMNDPISSVLKMVDLLTDGQYSIARDKIIERSRP